MPEGLLARLRRAAALVAHIGEGRVGAMIYTADGDIHVVGGRSGGRLDGDGFRAAVVDAMAQRSLAPVQSFLSSGAAAPLDVMMRGDQSLESFDGGIRWRRSTASGTTEYFVAHGDTQDHLMTAEHVLGSALENPRRHLGVQTDVGLGLSVIECRWPDDLGEADRARLQQALRDLAVVWRVRSNLDDPADVPA